MDIPEEIRDDLESRANVVGTGQGPKRVSGQTTDEESIVVLVSQKVPEAQLSEDDRIPKEVDIDGRRVKTDVQEVGDVRTQAITTRPVEAPDRKRRWRPAPAGVSFGHPEISAGTLGSPPLETETGETVVLTNAHVAAPLETAERGDDVLQPGPADGGSSEDALGTLFDFSEIARNQPTTTDSALVQVDPSDLEKTVLGVGEFAGFTEPTVDETYTKSGRTTGVTTGELQARDVRIRVGGYYDEPTVFTGVTVFGPMSAGGDSGSLIGIAEDGFRATHLLFAGSDRSTIGIPVPAVETEHGELTPYDESGGGPGGGSDGPGTVRKAVRNVLQDAYGSAAVSEESEESGADFRVDGPVSMIIVVADKPSMAPEAAGRALAVAEAGSVPVLAYSADIENATIMRLGHRLALLPVQL